MTFSPTNSQTSAEARTLIAALSGIHDLHIESELIRRQGAAALRRIAGKAHLREKLLAGLQAASLTKSALLHPVGATNRIG